MKKYGFLFLLVVLFIFSLASCGKDEEPAVKTQKEEIYDLAKSSGYTGSYQEWVNALSQEDIILQIYDGEIRWKKTDNSEWITLTSLSEYAGILEEQIQYRISDYNIQWKSTSSNEWKSLIELDTLTCFNLIDDYPEYRISDDYIEYKNGNDGEWRKLIDLSSLINPTNITEIKPQLRINKEYIQCKNTSDGKWYDLIEVSSLITRESKVTIPEYRINGVYLEWENPADNKWRSFADIFTLFDFNGSQVSSLDVLEFGVHDKYLECKLSFEDQWYQLLNLEITEHAFKVSAYEKFKINNPEYTKTESQWVSDILDGSFDVPLLDSDKILEGLQWKYIGDDAKTIEITGYLGYKKELIIPSVIDGSTVSNIALHNVDLAKCVVETLQLPDSITSLQRYALSSLFKLKTLEVSGNLTDIKNDFADTGSLIRVNIRCDYNEIDSFPLLQLGKAFGINCFDKEIYCLDDDGEWIEVHTHGNISYNEENHWQSCLFCDYIYETEEHNIMEITISEPTCSEYGKVLYHCTGCNYNYTGNIDKLEHEFNLNEYKYNASQHWNQCNNCDAKTNLESHKFVGDVCSICNFEPGKLSRIDSREELYVVFSKNGEEEARFTSLYKAIIYCTDNCEIDSYVLKKGQSDALFRNQSYFSSDSKDMFWYYTETTTLSRYSDWQSIYWSNALDSGEICVFKEYESQQLQPYANSYEIVGAIDGANSTYVWNVCWDLESNATVNLISYSGITKAEYKVDLTQARIYPSYLGSDQSWAYVGIITADSYNNSHLGLRCNPETGDWYYYSGETSYNYQDIDIDESNPIFGSTWDEELKCFIPDSDVTMTMELLNFQDEFGSSYIVHRITFTLSNGQTFVRDYEISALTMCATIRFTCGLDIVTENSFPDYMNGGRFENVVVSKGVGYVLETMDDMLYGNFMELETGEYNLLNSLPASQARYQTILYTPSTVSYNFSTPGKDIYSFSYDN